MGRKRQQINEFYFFMVEKKPEMEKKLGRSVKMEELPNLVYGEWKSMSEAKKQKYKDMKERTRETTEKLDCRGVPLNELKRRDDEKKRKLEEMKKDVGNAIDFHRTGNALHRLTIYVASVSYYVHTDEDQYTPAELAIAYFNFEKGIMREHHVIFKPVIPMCYGFIAQEHSQGTHNLLDEHNTGVDDIEEVVAALDQFVGQESGRAPPLYTLDTEKVHTETILDSIAGKGHFRIYSLDHYFQSVYSAAFPEHPIPESISTDMLNHCGLDFHPAMACDWHINFQPDSGKYCSLSCIRRWMFNMCDNMNLSTTFGIEPQEGKHLPRAIPAYGVLVDVPKPTFKDERGISESRQTASGFKDDKNSSFSFTRSRKEELGATALSPAKTKMWSNPTSPSTLEAFRKPDRNAWSRAVSSTPSGPSRASSMASVCSSKVDATSEEDFPALGAGVARRGTDNQPSYASLGGVGRGLMRGPLSPRGDTLAGRGRGLSSQPK